MYSPWLQQLDNGMRSLFWESPFTRIATVQCFLPGGRRLESLQNAGITQLIAHQMLQDYQDFLEDLGSSVAVEVEADYLLITAKCLANDLAELLHFLANLFPKVRFNAGTLTNVKQEFTDRLAEQQYNPFHLAYQQLQFLLYGHHPYGFSPWGTLDSLQNLDVKDLQDYYDRLFVPGHLSIAITANSNPDRIGELVAQAFGGWRSERSAPMPGHQTAEFRAGWSEQPWTGEQTWLMVGFPAPSVHDEDFFAMKIINAHLGTGSSSRLFQLLREEEGWVYDVSTNCPTRFDRSHLFIHCTTAPHLRSKVQNLILAECDRLQGELLNSEDLELAKNKLLGHYALAKQATAHLAHINGWYHTLQLPPDFDFQFVKQVEKNTPQMIQRAAQKYLARWAVSIVG